jgi:hypothetical protein
MKIENMNLLHFKNEPYQNYENYIYDLLDAEGADIVDTMLSNKSNAYGAKSTGEHIEQRHIEMTEKDMVHMALKTGQIQGIFAMGYDNPMVRDDFKDMIYGALWENAEKMAQQFVDYRMPFQKTFNYNTSEFIGYGINKDFNLVKADSIGIVFRLSDDPFSKLGIEIETVYPIITENGEIIKNKDALKKEYNIDDRDLIKFKTKQHFRDNIKEIKGRIKEERSRKAEDRDFKPSEFNR